MTGVWWTVALAVAWVLLTGTLTTENAILGFALGTAVVLVAGRAVGAPRYVRTVVASIRLLVVFAIDLFIANLYVAFDVITPKSRLRPGIIAVPLSAETDTEITLLANLITLTPGTTSIEVSADRKTLYVHVMYLHREGAEATRLAIKRQLEQRVLEVTR